MRAALADIGVPADKVAAVIDTVGAIRSFEVSSPASSSPLGRPDNMPRAVAARTGLHPRRAVHEVTGVRHLTSAEFPGEAPDFTDHVDGDLIDRGYGIAGLTSVDEVRHGLRKPLEQYALLENARRHRLGLDRAGYAQSMGELFAPMSAIAAKNPFSAAPTERTAAELITPSESNRVVAEPYTRLIVARDQVNQAAACIVMSIATARQLGIAVDRWVFLHGHASLREQSLMRRRDLSRGPASVAALRHALDVADVSLDDVPYLDLYSCFPIAVSNICEAFGLDADDPRGLTVTGGLPFFGGPGNNYSMHAIAEIVERVRRDPGSRGLVAANGGVLSKYSVGIYSTTPRAWRADAGPRIQAALDAEPRVPITDHPSGPARVEIFTVPTDRKGRRNAIVIGRLDEGSGAGINVGADVVTGRRFIATVERDDDAMFDLLTDIDDPIGSSIVVWSTSIGNRVTTDEASMIARHPYVVPAFRDSYEHVLIHRDGHVLEVTINRPDARNALNPAANAELDAVFDAYFADPDLWVAILTGAGDKAFSAGNDLAASAGPAALDIPLNGFAGLTSRRAMPKPLIAAVNGFALGGGCEIAMACHLIVADENASFGLPEVKVGLAALAGGLVRLPAAIPGALARDMILTGRRLSAAEALDAGLISRVAPAGEVMELARAVADEIVACSPTSVRASIAAMEDVASMADPIDAIESTAAVLDTLLVSQDTIEGITAFVTKREPRWVGH